MLTPSAAPRAILSLRARDGRPAAPRMPSPWRHRPVDPQQSLPRPRAGGPRALAGARRLPRVAAPPRGRRAVGLLRGPADRERPPGRAPRPLARVQGHLSPLQDHARATSSSARAAGTATACPVEIAVEQQLGLKNKHEIEAYGIAEFNQQVPRVGLRVPRGLERADRAHRLLGRPRRRVPHARPHVHRVGLVGAAADLRQGPALRGPQGRAVLPALRHRARRHEVALGYKDVIDPSVYVRFPVAEDGGPLQRGDELLVWTTTPWTLVSNAAVAVHPELTYVRAKTGPLEAPVVLAEALVERVLGSRDVKILDRFPGAALDGVRYEPPFPYIPGQGVRRARPHGPARRLRHRRRRHRPRPHRDRVRRGRLPARRALRPERRQPGPARRHLRRADRQVRRALRQGRRPRPHRGPPRARPAAARRGLRARLPALLALRRRRSSTTPSRPGTSRRRRCATGCSPPTRRSTGTRAHQARALRQLAREQRRLGAVARALLGHAAAGLALPGRPRALHRVVRRARGALGRRAWRTRTGRTSTTSAFPCPHCARRMQRVPEVIDVWFDSGAMPFAQDHAPFENEEAFRERLPRRLHLRGARPDARLVLLAAGDRRRSCSTARRTENVVCLGLLLDEEGQKMSKSKGNIVMPWDVLDRFGADAFRWYFFTSKQPWDGYQFSMERVGEGVRLFLRAAVEHLRLLRPLRERQRRPARRTPAS